MPNQIEQDAAFQHALIQANDAISKDLKGELALPWRNSLWLAMGLPGEDEEGAPVGIGWQRRVRLGILAVEHVLPLWQKQYPQDQGPQRMLSLAEQVLKGEADRIAASAESDSYWSQVSDLGFQGDDQETGDGKSQVLPFCVGAAAARVVRTALVDYQMVLYQESNQDKTEIDADRDAWMWDESYFAAMAYAGGDAWTASSSFEKRYEFWQWWLEQAVPEAYHSITD